MVKQHELKAPAGARKPPKRVGRGDASGHGSYSGRGRKGQKSRAGKRMRPGLEGGQLPLILGMPTKKGFHNPFPKNYQLVKVEDLEGRFEAGAEVTPQRMLEAGLLRNLRLPVKVLANGDVSKPMTVTAHRFSASAKAKIGAAGGKVQELEAMPKAAGKGHKGPRKAATKGPQGEDAHGASS
ncbi:MAG: 50S ribosomal protein L15 [Chloroflexi bacterium]|nr:50S ribosomal protein L15 [Chloroflexota bacterium]